MGIGVQEELTEVMRLLPLVGQFEICCCNLEQQNIQHPTAVFGSWEWSTAEDTGKCQIKYFHLRVDDTSRVTIWFLFWPMWFCLSSQGKSYNKSDDRQVFYPTNSPFDFVIFAAQVVFAEIKHKRSMLDLSMSFLLRYSSQPSLCIFVPSNEVTDFIMEQQWP